MAIRPQPGPQTAFITTPADICVYGGAAGGGKTFGLLLGPLYHVTNPNFGAVIFRRSTVQVRNEGGLWDESMQLYPKVGAMPRESNLQWAFKSGAAMKFAHLEYDKTVLDWQGSAIAYIGYDELTHFTEKQFFYMQSRNRSTCGVRPRIRATTNPDVDSWVRPFIDWWIDDNGFAIKSRAGQIRFFIRLEDKIIWADKRQHLIDKYGPEEKPKSFTFIPSSIRDNPILMQKDPNYLSNLRALSRVDRLRLLEGNWNVRATAGNYFRREWFPLVDAVPATVVQSIRYWDRAATKPHEANKNPDWTRGLKMSKLSTGQYIVEDIRGCQESPLYVEQIVKNTAQHDGYSIRVGIEQDPGGAGVAEAMSYVRLLAGFDVRLYKPTKDKATRAKPVSAQSEAGNILIKRAPWNDEFFKEVESFPEGSHDDMVDTLSGAFNELSQGSSILDTL